MNNMVENTDKTLNNDYVKKESVEITVKDLVKILCEGKKLFFV